MAVYLICYAAGFLLAHFGHFLLSGAVLMGAAVWLYISDYRKSGSLIHLRGIFSLAWVGGQGISCLKLSRLQEPWSVMTWLCFLAAFAGFYLTFEYLTWRYPGRRGPRREGPRWNYFRDAEGRIFISMAVILTVSVLCFILEAAVLGYVPYFLRGVPHAYSEFHITGVHYFTVSCVLVPALSVIYLYSNQGRSPGKCRAVLAMDVVAVLIPILCVSRFQLILGVALAVLTYMAMDSRVPAWYGLAAAAALVPFYIILTIARSHDVEYLNGIFEMKNAATPIFITQPYMYVANNYDNFNCLVENLAGHTFGLKMLFPLWALTGLKFLKPELVNFQIFVNKEELTTLTLFYDAYYDFGIAGVLLFSCLLGALAWYLMGLLKKMRNPVGYLFYAQIAMYFALSFFTTWFSNPTTWFWFVLTGIVALFVGRYL